MTTNTWVDLEIPEAKTLADLTGIRYDLNSARDLAKMLEAEIAAEAPNWQLADPLSTAILVRYSRAFASGVRSPLGNDALAVLSPEQREMHARLRAIRDKHLAHSVNAFEENQPVARYCEERVSQEGITSVECNHSRILGLNSREIAGVIELTTVFLEFVDGRLQEEKQRLLHIVRSMPLERVLAGRQKALVPDIDSPVARKRAK